jgi:hypothetical protein
VPAHQPAGGNGYQGAGYGQYPGYNYGGYGGYGGGIIIFLFKIVTFYITISSKHMIVLGLVCE